MKSCVPGLRRTPVPCIRFRKSCAAGRGATVGSRWLVRIPGGLLAHPLERHRAWFAGDVSADERGCQVFGRVRPIRAGTATIAAMMCRITRVTLTLVGASSASGWMNERTVTITAMMTKTRS